MVRTPGIPARLEAFVFDQNEAAVDLHAQAESQALKCARGCQDGWVCTRALQLSRLSRAPSRPDAHAGTCAPLSGRGRTSRARFARLCDCGRTGTQGGEERRTYRVRRALQAACTRALAALASPRGGASAPRPRRGPPCGLGARRPPCGVGRLWRALRERGARGAAAQWPHPCHIHTA